MPARKNPVKNRTINKVSRVLPSIIIPKLSTLPMRLQKKNTLEGENRSAIVNIANDKVPMINPNWIAEVRYPNEVSSNWKDEMRSSITPLPANHNDVQQNCAITIIGSISLDLLICNCIAIGSTPSGIEKSKIQH